MDSLALAAVNGELVPEAEGPHYLRFSVCVQALDQTYWLTTIPAIADQASGANMAANGPGFFSRFSVWGLRPVPSERATLRCVIDEIQLAQSSSRKLRSPCETKARTASSPAATPTS